MWAAKTEESKGMMKFRPFILRAFTKQLLGGVGVILATYTSVNAATTTNVSVGDLYFSPQNVSINTGDTVLWTWVGSGLYFHNSTGPGVPPLWASASTGTAGYQFSYSFTAAGTYAYVCTYHSFYGMTGSVSVQGALNVPPVVGITRPTNGATFVAPWTGLIEATASDSDDSVSQVAFYQGANPLGSVLNPGSTLSFGVTNLPAGDYNLTAVATDSRGSATTSAVVLIHVRTPSPILLSSMERLATSRFAFQYSATPGLSYVVARSPSPENFFPISTNTATNSVMTFVDDSATAPWNFYRLNVVPNP